MPAGEALTVVDFRVLSALLRAIRVLARPLPRATPRRLRVNRRWRGVDVCVGGRRHLRIAQAAADAPARIPRRRRRPPPTPRPPLPPLRLDARAATFRRLRAVHSARRRRWRARERREAVRARRGGARGSRRVGPERAGPRERSWRACGGDAPLIPASVALLYNLCSAQVEV